MSAIRNKNKYISLKEDEPPEKKILSDGDLLIRQLAQKQQDTKVNLKEQLLNPKIFESSTELTPFSSYCSGTSTLEQFEGRCRQTEETEKLKAAGLSKDDIDLILEYRSGEIYERHKKIDQNILNERINKLFSVLNKYEEKHSTAVESVDHGDIQSRHKAEFGLSIKPESVQTKLLKFALQNERKSKIHLPHPMDKIKDLEKQVFGHLGEKPISSHKIQKRLRNLASSINNIEQRPKEPSEHANLKAYDKIDVAFVNESKWDQRVPDINADCKNDKPKIYTCNPLNYYTVRNGNIVKLSDNEIKIKNLDVLRRKLSVDEIRNLPKFANYESGLPSKVLFLKNMPRSITETDLKQLFSHYNRDSSCLFRIMTGRMRGQAFITFTSEQAAAAALEDINGTLIGNKPVVIEFGKQKENDCQK